MGLPSREDLAEIAASLEDVSKAGRQAALTLLYLGDIAKLLEQVLPIDPNECDQAARALPKIAIALEKSGGGDQGDLEPGMDFKAALESLPEAT